MEFKIDIKKYGEKAILINWPQKIDEQILNDILSVKKIVLKNFQDILDVNNGYCSLLILFNRKVTDSNIEMLGKILNDRKEVFQTKKNKLWRIPVCYHLSFGTDLENLSRTKKLSNNEIVHLHTEPSYKVFCKGFLPGFMYLGGLNKKLHTPRKPNPELNIPKNSVAIGGSQTGIYPTESPGGWHIIGRTPIALFSIKNTEFSEIKTGDTIQFYSVSLADFLAFKTEEKSLNFLQKIE